MKPRTDALPVVALAGNPNCGKTTLFNLLTGARQQTGNWPGVTVERRVGSVELGARRASLVDLPGVYSLLGGGGEDQRVARDFLLGDAVDLVVLVVDASNLERHLQLGAELIETGLPLVVVLNMVDEARAAGLEPQADALAKHLGVPVVAMVARRGRGRRELLDTLADALRRPPRPHRAAAGPAAAAAVDLVAARVAGGSRLQALRLLEQHATPTTRAEFAALREAARLLRDAGEPPQELYPTARAAWAHDTAAIALRRGERGAPPPRRVGDALDALVLHRWLGVPLFLMMLYAVFVASFAGGNVLLDLFDQGSEALLIDGAGHLLWRAGLPEWAISALAGGVGGGLHLVIAFIPPIALTFVLLALLDDSGYLARAAYAMDRLMRRFGLPGHALVPMVIGFGCNVPAIMGTRVIDDARGRLLTVLVQPFMSCSARLTIYLAFAVVFFRDHGGQLVFALYLLGIVAALLSALLIGRTALPGKPLPLLVELPPYRVPSVRSVLLQAWQRLRVFVLRVGRVIVAIGVVLLLLPAVGVDAHGVHATDVEHSLLAQGSRALTPLFAPMGLRRDNWPAVAGLVAGAAAKEVVIGTLNGIHQRRSGADQLLRWRDPELGPRLRAALRTVPDNAAALGGALLDPLDLRALGAPRDAAAASGASASTLAALAAGFTPLSAFAYLVFVLLYVPCASTMGALRREVGWRWMAFSTGYGIGLAWCAATVVYQLGSFGAHPLASTAWIALCAAAFAALARVLRRRGTTLAATAGERSGDASAAAPRPSCARCGGCGGCAGAAPARRRPRPPTAPLVVVPRRR